MKLNGLMPTMGKWEGSVPGRVCIRRTAMYSMDGPLRLTQLWPYPSLEARAKARAQRTRSRGSS